MCFFYPHENHGGYWFTLEKLVAVKSWNVMKTPFTFTIFHQTRTESPLETLLNSPFIPAQRIQPSLRWSLEKEMPQGPRGTLLQWRQPGTRRGWSRLVSYGGFRSHEGTPSPHPIVMGDHDVYWNNHGGLGFPNFLNPPNGDGSKVGSYLHMGFRGWSFPTDFSSLGIWEFWGTWDI